jgi:hypothetical protein
MIPSKLHVRNTTTVLPDIRIIVVGIPTNCARIGPLIKRKVLGTSLKWHKQHSQTLPLFPAEVISDIVDIC